MVTNIFTPLALKNNKNRILLIATGIFIMLFSLMPESMYAGSKNTEITKKHIILDAGHGTLNLCFKTST